MFHCSQKKDFINHNNFGRTGLGKLHCITQVFSEIMCLKLYSLLSIISYFSISLSSSFSVHFSVFNLIMFVIQGIKNFSPTAASLLAAIAKIDNSYYPEVFILPFSKAICFPLIFLCA